MGRISHDAVAGWVSAADPEGLLYGAIVSAAVLAAISAHAEGAEYVAISTSVVLVVYWLGHVYINTLTTQFEGDTRQFLPRLRTSLAHESSVLKGGFPAVVVYVALAATGAAVSTAAAVAVYFSIGLLAAVGYLGARQAGLRGRATLLEMAGGAAFGVVIVAAKTLLH